MTELSLDDQIKRLEALFAFKKDVDTLAERVAAFEKQIADLRAILERLRARSDDEEIDRLFA